MVHDLERILDFHGFVYNKMRIHPNKNKKTSKNACFTLLTCDILKPFLAPFYFLGGLRFPDKSSTISIPKRDDKS